MALNPLSRSAGSAPSPVKQIVGGGGILTSAAATTPIQALPDAQVPSNKSLFVGAFTLKVNGATPWTGAGTVFRIKGTDGTLYASIAKSALTANAFLTPFSTGVTLATAFTNGGVAANGLVIDCDGAFAGSDILFDFVGYLSDRIS